MVQLIKKFFGLDDGASLAEYSLLLAFILLAAFGTVEALGLDMVPWFQKVASQGFGA